MTVAFYYLCLVETISRISTFTQLPHTHMMIIMHKADVCIKASFLDGWWIFFSQTADAQQKQIPHIKNEAHRFY